MPPGFGHPLLASLTIWLVGGGDKLTDGRTERLNQGSFIPFYWGDLHTHEHKDGRIDAQMDAWMDRWTDGRMDAYTD